MFVIIQTVNCPVSRFGISNGYNIKRTLFLSFPGLIISSELIALKVMNLIGYTLFCNLKQKINEINQTIE